MAHCDNITAIHISKNHVQHVRTKHINICHHFIRNFIENKTVVIEHVATDKQLVDIFTKTLDASKLVSQRKALGICIL